MKARWWQSGTEEGIVELSVSTYFPGTKIWPLVTKQNGTFPPAFGNNSPHSPTWCGPTNITQKHRSHSISTSASAQDHDSLATEHPNLVNALPLNHNAIH